MTPVRFATDMKSRTEAHAGTTIAGVASIVVGVIAVVTALYGFENDPLGTALYNQFRIGVSGPIILSALVAAIGLASAGVGLRGRHRWPAIIGVVVNASALLPSLCSLRSRTVLGLEERVLRCDCSFEPESRQVQPWVIDTDLPTRLP